MQAALTMVTDWRQDLDFGKVIGDIGEKNVIKILEYFLPRSCIFSINLSNFDPDQEQAEQDQGPKGAMTNSLFFCQDS